MDQPSGSPLRIVPLQSSSSSVSLNLRRASGNSFDGAAAAAVQSLPVGHVWAESFEERVDFHSASRSGAVGSFQAGSRSADPISMQRQFSRVMGNQIYGMYLAKFAVWVTACYLGIQLMMTFAEVLLPFIFAVLGIVILEPIKRWIVRIFTRLTAIALGCVGLQVCLDTIPGGDVTPKANADYGGVPTEDEEHSGLPLEQRPLVTPVPGVKRTILVMSIIFCMLLTGRVLWTILKVFFRAGGAISGNLEFYRQGADRLKRWFEVHIQDMHISSQDYGSILDDLVQEVEDIGSVVTQNILYAGLQGMVTFIFVIYMLWSPIKMDSNTMTTEVFGSTGRYLKVKCLISAFTGLSVAFLLWSLGLDLPAAFGLLAFLANFLPGIGSIVASVLPCILAAIDVRKTPTQVFLAFTCQTAVHFIIDFVIEPVFFGISVEIHSVIVILGIYFFYQVWGVPGMLLSVPLLAVVRSMMKSMKRAYRSSSGEDTDTIAFLDNILEGRWMSSVGGRPGEEELEMADVWQGRGSKASSSSGNLQPHGPPAAADAEHSSHPASTWDMIMDSDPGRDLRDFYNAHGLLLDITGLVFVLGIVVFIPI